MLSEMPTDHMKKNPQEPPEAIILPLDNARFAEVELGQSKVNVLDILVPSENLDTNQSLADQYEKDGESHEILYFRTTVYEIEDIRVTF